MNIPPHTNGRLKKVTNPFGREATVTFPDNTTATVSYAWGRQCNWSSHVYIPSGQEVELFLGRGYSGHEHLKEFGLVNMNARLYDPALGRCLAPDPFVQMPDLCQNFNCYSYAMNNPLRYVDEDGEFFWVAIGIAAAIGAATNVATHWKEIKATGGGWKGSWQGIGYLLSGGLEGGAAMAMGVVVGFSGVLSATATQVAAASTGFISGASIGVVSGATSGFLLNTSNIWG